MLVEIDMVVVVLLGLLAEVDALFVLLRRTGFVSDSPTP